MKPETENLRNRKGIIDGTSSRGKAEKVRINITRMGPGEGLLLNSSKFKTQITMETFSRGGNWGEETMLQIRSLKHAQQRTGSI